MVPQTRQKKVGMGSQFIMVLYFQFVKECQSLWLRQQTKGTSDGAHKLHVVEILKEVHVKIHVKIFQLLKMCVLSLVN